MSAYIQVMLGDVSLCGYTLQMPVAKLYLWILHARVEVGHSQELMSLVQGKACSLHT